MNANSKLKALLSDVLTHGDDVVSRAGNTKELRFVSFTVSDPQDRYITLPERRVSVPHQIAETMWVLAGRNDVEWLSTYLPQAANFADDGKHWRAGYGPRLRNWHNRRHIEQTDQVHNVIQLLRKDPSTRRAVMSIWDPDLDFTDSKDIPCNNWLHFLARDGVLDLNIAIRSNDLMWGWSGINFFEWSVLLEIVAHHAGLKVGSLHFNVSSLHLYERHFDKARRIVENRDLYSDPMEGREIITYNGAYGKRDLDELITQWFYLEGRIREHGDLSGIENMKDSLLWTWLWAIAYYHGHEEKARLMLRGTDILPALELSPKRKVPLDVDLEPLIKRMQDLHTEKSAAYGNSWKKRGELFSIIPNIARKVDRIVADTVTSDETKLDTAMDLVIYLAKYYGWLITEELTDDDASTEFENDQINELVQTHWDGPQVVEEQVFADFLCAVEVKDDDVKMDKLAILGSQAVGYLIKLWTGPEGRALRNEKRSWNPDVTIMPGSTPIPGVKLEFPGVKYGIVPRSEISDAFLSAKKS